MAINLLGSFLENWARFLQVCYLVSSDHINVGSYLKQNVKAIRMIWIRLSGDFIDGVIYLCVLLSFSFLSLPFPYLPTQALLKKVADLCHQRVRKCHLWHRSTDPPTPVPAYYMYIPQGMLGPGQTFLPRKSSLNTGTGVVFFNQGQIFSNNIQVY